MTYSKPQFVPLDSAISAIQGHTKGCLNAEGSTLVTPDAYEADE
jgi:hypothetical protein